MIVWKPNETVIRLSYEDSTFFNDYISEANYCEYASILYSSAAKANQLIKQIIKS